MHREPTFDIDSPEHRRKLVRRVVAGESPGGELFEALLDIAAGSDRDFSVEAWQAILDKLDNSNLKVGRWVDNRRKAEK